MPLSIKPLDNALTDETTPLTDGEYQSLESNIFISPPLSVIAFFYKNEKNCK